MNRLNEEVETVHEEIETGELYFDVTLKIRAIQRHLATHEFKASNEYFITLE